MEMICIAFAGFLLAACVIAQATAADIRIACYSDANECEVTQDLARRFMQANQDVRITIDRVPFKAILESLPVQLAGGQGPDIARTTDFGAIARYFLDIRPLVKDAAYWDANFAQTLSWMRTDPNDKGIYGLPMQLTVTAPIVNATLFEQAGVPLPGPKATWDEWAARRRKGRQGDEDGGRHGIGSQRPSVCRRRALIRSEVFRRGRNAGTGRRRLQRVRRALRQLEQNGDDRTRGVGGHRRRQLPRRI